MQPLDLSTRAPRSCRAELDGIIFLPRAIDKVRAELPGGKPGNYFSLQGTIPTLSSMFYYRMGCSHEEFVAAVAAAADESEVLSWLRGRVTDEAIAKFTKQILGIHLGDLAAPSREGVNRFYPAAAGMSDETLLIDMIDADDAAAFANVHT